MKIAIPIIIIILILSVVGYFIFQIMQDDPQYDFTQVYITNVNSNINTAPQIEEPIFIEPIAEFQERITKKPFGIYITPDTSPIQPEKFSGYHTAVDVEYPYTISDVPVIAISDGEVVASKTVSGYGGVVIIKHTINDNEEILSIYGHLNDDRSVDKNKYVKQGDVIGYLGKDKTKETDFERRHLHFGIIKGDKINYHGYVDDENELENWYDPILFY
ncbi:MAG: M23 family metallopeptidase [Candidatus Kerfeldbacteria bacterium]|jgi:murein DD-endopeptidase MepM/ murein hydrolase activator NlpD